MSKKILITLEIEVEDDDYESDFKQDVEENNLETFHNLLCDLVSDDEELPPVVSVSLLHF